MHVSFELSMPNNNAWNGRWSGEGGKYVRVLTVSESTRAKFEALINAQHVYDFGDGWTACVTVKEVTGADKRKLLKSSKGFCGYDWMIDSLRYHGSILNDSQIRNKLNE